MVHTVNKVRARQEPCTNYDIQLMIWVRSLVHAWVAIVSALTDSRQSQILLLFMYCVRLAP